MRQVFTDEELRQVILEAAGSLGDAINVLKADRDVHSNEVAYIRAILSALPEPQSEWEKCDYGDVKLSDEAVIFAFEDGTSLEGIPHDRGLTVIDLKVGGLIRTISYGDAKAGGANIYRIPAPGRHPDPSEHPHIKDVTFEFPAGKISKSGTFQAEILSYTPNGSGWCGISVDGDLLTGIESEQISDWTPAKVIADE